MRNKLRISDNKDRTLLQIRNDKVLVARFEGMSEKTKNTIIEFYTELTGESPSRVMDFLNYKNDELEFCS